MEFGVVLFDPAALFHRASGRAHTETQVPQGAGEFGDQWPKFRFRLFIAEKKQEIKVRVRKKHFAAVAAQCQKAESLPGSIPHTQQLRKDFLDDIICKLTQLPQRILRACAVVKKLPDAFP